MILNIRNSQIIFPIVSILIIGIASYAPASYSFPISATFVNDKRCDPIPDTHLTEELGQNPTAPIPFPKDEEIDAVIGPPPAPVCVANDGDNVNDFPISITNLSPNFFTNLFFVADTNITIGNADGTINGDDAFLIDNVGINSNLIAESMNPNLIFEPGETWEFIVTNFGAPNAGESPAFFSRGIGVASLNVNLSSASIVAQPFIFTANDNVIPFENFVLAPLKQIQQGIEPSDVVCKNNYELVLKLSNLSSACVKPSSVEKLIERGWGEKLVSNNLE